MVDVRRARFNREAGTMEVSNAERNSGRPERAETFVTGSDFVVRSLVVLIPGTECELICRRPECVGLRGVLFRRHHEQLIRLARLDEKYRDFDVPLRHFGSDEKLVQDLVVKPDAISPFTLAFGTRIDLV